MFWKMIKARTDAMKDKSSYDVLDKDVLCEELVKSKACEVSTAVSEFKHSLRWALGEALKDMSAYNKKFHKVMAVCMDSPRVFQYLLELLVEDKDLASKFQIYILDWIIVHQKREFLIPFISKLEMTDCEAAWMYTEPKDFSSSDDTIYSILADMDLGELHEFFRINSENISLRFAIAVNINTIIEALYERVDDVEEAIFSMLEFFPECVKPVFLYILGQSDYTEGCELELNVLQFIADSRYGYLFPKCGEVREIYDWVKHNALDIILKANAERCTSQVVWLLENEFEVEVDDIYYVLDECVLSFINEFNEWSYFKDSIELQWSDYMDSAAGYYALWGNVYELAKLFPRDVVKIKSSFSNIDSERLLESAGAL